MDSASMDSTNRGSIKNFQKKYSRKFQIAKLEFAALATICMAFISYQRYKKPRDDIEYAGGCVLYANTIPFYIRVPNI